MGSSINSSLFKAGGNLARPTKFEAFLSFPESFSNSTGSIDSRDFNILLKGASIPSHSNESLQVFVKGHPIEIPGRTNYVRKITCTFLLDAKEQLIKDLSDWIQASDTKRTNNSSSIEYMEYGDDSFFGELTIDSYDLDFTKGTSYKFEGLFPTSISSVEFNGDQISSVLEVTVDFAFFNLEIVSPSGVNSLIFSNLVNEGTDKAISYAKDLTNNIRKQISNSEISKKVLGMTTKQKFLKIFKN